MPSRISTIRGLKEGELVWHVLYGREWIGLLLEIIEDGDETDRHREMALVHMQPNTKYSLFFQKKVLTKHRVTDSMGYVSLNWLFKLEGDKYEQKSTTQEIQAPAQSGQSEEES